MKRLSAAFFLPKNENNLAPSRMNSEYSASRFGQFCPVAAGNGACGLNQPVMFHFISWTSYLIGVFLLTILYYSIIGAAFYRKEISLILRRFTQQPGVRPESIAPVAHADPEYQIMGDAQAEPAQLVDLQELSFGPAEISDEADGSNSPKQAHTGIVGNAHLEREFSAMKDEVKTLISVITDGNESLESFRMLFVLIAQKYPDIPGSPYQELINAILFQELQGKAGFELSREGLQSFWNDSLTPKNA